MSKIQRNTPLSQNTPIGSPLGVGVSSIGGVGGIQSRYIRTMNGVNQYGTLNTSPTFLGDFSVEIEAYFPAVTDGLLHALVGIATDTRAVIRHTDGIISVNFTAAGTARTYTLLPAINDGKIHKVLVSVIANTSITVTIDGIHTQTQSVTDTTNNAFTLIGESSTGRLFSGAILSVKFNDNSVSPSLVTNYVIDNADTTTTYARGHLSPSTYYITWANFTAADIQLARYNAPLRRWESTTTADVWEYA